MNYERMLTSYKLSGALNEVSSSVYRDQPESSEDFITRFVNDVTSLTSYLGLFAHNGTLGLLKCNLDLNHLTLLGH